MDHQSTGDKCIIMNYCDSFIVSNVYYMCSHQCLGNLTY